MRYWINRGALLGNAEQSCQDLEKGSSGAVGKISGVCAWLPANCHRMLGRVGSDFFCVLMKCLGW